METGNTLYTENNCTGFLNVDEAELLVNNHVKSELHSTQLETALHGETLRESFGNALRSLPSKPNTAIVFISNGKTISFVAEGKESIILMDSHRYQNKGALVAKAEKIKKKLEIDRLYNLIIERLEIKVKTDVDITLVEYKRKGLKEKLGKVKKRG
jgi:hypothetical protein